MTRLLLLLASSLGTSARIRRTTRPAGPGRYPHPGGASGPGGPPPQDGPWDPAGPFRHPDAPPPTDPAGLPTPEAPADACWPGGSGPTGPRGGWGDGGAPGRHPGAWNAGGPAWAETRARFRGRRLVPRWAPWAAAAAVTGLIFRRAVASVVLLALSAVLQAVGVNARLPSVSFAWPWQSAAARPARNVTLGPWVLQKIEGISRPALGRANFSFVFTHKVSKSIGPWPCWYASTFYAVGHASATVDLNPGPAWWAPGTGHYRLRVLSRPGPGQRGQVAVAMVLPRPQLPQTAHDVTIDNIPSKPLATHHSWTYPGFGCGVLLRPQFQQAALYRQAQRIAFDRARHVPAVTRPLIRSAETQATRTIRDDFVQPTVNALGYRLAHFALRWASHP